MSDTPKTDAAEWKSQYGRVECLVVEADFARTLERELLRAQEQRGEAILKMTAAQCNAKKMLVALEDIERYCRYALPGMPTSLIQVRAVIAKAIDAGTHPLQQAFNDEIAKLPMESDIKTMPDAILTNEAKGA